MAAVSPTEENGTANKGVHFANKVASFATSTTQGHTPFRKTPVKQRISTKDVTIENPEQIAMLLQKQWCLYHITPLYKFSYAMLKTYSRDLSVFFHAEKKGLAVEIGIELNSKANFSLLAGLKLTEHDPEAVFIQISSKSQVPQTKDKVVWTGWLCCVDGDPGFLESLPGEFICLPLLFVNGTESITTMVAAWFQKTFDCYISAFCLSSENLCWMAAMCVNCFSDSVQRFMELEWTVPPVQLTISLSIHSEDVKALWDGIHRDEDEIAVEEVQLFMSSLHSHFHRHFGVRLAATHLVKVSTAVASAHCDGKLKLFNSKHIYQVLSFLTELAFLQTQHHPHLSQNMDYLD